MFHLSYYISSRLKIHITGVIKGSMTLQLDKQTQPTYQKDKICLSNVPENHFVSLYCAIFG